MSNMILGIIVILSCTISALITQPPLSWAVVITFTSGATLFGYGLREVLEKKQ